MASSASPIAMLELMATGEKGSTWGTIANTNFKILERFSNGYLSVTVDSATKTLTTATDFSLQDWHYAVFDLASATQAANFVVPSQPKLFGVVNSATGAYTMTVKTSTGGSVALDQDATAVLFNDGTDVRKLFLSTDYQPLDSDLTALAGVSSGGLLARTAAGTAAARSIAAGSAISVANGTATGGNPTISADINGTTTATDTVATGDFLLLYDVSLGALRKATTSSVVGAAGGDVDGPGSATDNAWARFDGTTGKIIQNGTWVEDDSGNVTAGGTLDMNGNDASVDKLAARATGQSKRTTDQTADASADTDLTVDGAQVRYLKLTGDHTVNVFGATGADYAANGYVLEVEQDGTGSRNLTIQKGSLLTNSNELGTDNINTHWLRTNVTPVQDVTSPAGEAWTLSATGATSVQHRIDARRSTAVTPWDYTVAALLKAGATSRAILRVQTVTFGKGALVAVDLSAGTIDTPSAVSTGVVLASGIIDCGDGWYLVHLSADVGSDGGVAVETSVLLADAAGNATFTQAGETLLFGGAILDASAEFRGFQHVGASRAIDGWIGTEVDFSAQAASTKTTVAVEGPEIDGYLVAAARERS